MEGAKPLFQSPIAAKPLEASGEAASIQYLHMNTSSLKMQKHYAYEDNVNIHEGKAKKGHCALRRSRAAPKFWDHNDFQHFELHSSSCLGG